MSDEQYKDAAARNEEVAKDSCYAGPNAMVLRAIASGAEQLPSPMKFTIVKIRNGFLVKDGASDRLANHYETYRGLNCFIALEEAQAFIAAEFAK
mgnify:CR=1 FL=1